MRVHMNKKQLMSHVNVYIQCYCCCIKTMKYIILRIMVLNYKQYIVHV